MSVLINIDVPDLEPAITFYTEGLGLMLSRRFDEGFAELAGPGVLIYLLAKPTGSEPAPGAPPRSYARHWTPVHLDFQVDDVPVAVARAVAAGATLESPPEAKPYGELAMLADPFGHGFCLIRLAGQGYGVYLGDTG
ncbi:VOC family protein [Chitiniphilus purpureus]|uniref:VOC family protein n=1 Tax=Chitiniphilus purpureus TaxID=2981137 RepID=A0ABY6DPL9_9NEIS|nr:VOC family protein [Chitiniphilus sp. CD1]UXY16317.1 VOC family protein [Chitiniphilus sp. CD1]